MRQIAGFNRPVIGRVSNRSYVTVLYRQKTVEGLVWIEIKDQENRLGWLPQICLQPVTLTPTKTPRVTTPSPEGN